MRNVEPHGPLLFPVPVSSTDACDSSIVLDVRHARHSQECKHPCTPRALTRTIHAQNCTITVLENIEHGALFRARTAFRLCVCCPPADWTLPSLERTVHGKSLATHSTVFIQYSTLNLYELHHSVRSCSMNIRTVRDLLLLQSEVYFRSRPPGLRFAVHLSKTKKLTPAPLAERQVRGVAGTQAAFQRSSAGRGGAQEISNARSRPPASSEDARLRQRASRRGSLPLNSPCPGSCCRNINSWQDSRHARIRQRASRGK